MKIPASVLSALLISSSTGSVLAITTYTTDFGDPPFSAASPLAGQDGWSISNPPPTDLSFIYNYNSVNDPTNPWGALGGFKAVPDVNPTHLTHLVDLPLTALLFSVDFAISSTQLLSPATRDKFAWSFNSANPGDLFRIAFEPDAGNPNKLEVVWYDSGGNRQTLTGPVTGIAYDSIYNLHVDVVGAGADAQFTATITPSVGTPLIFTETLTGQAGATVSSFGADFETVAASPFGDAGDNTMFFDNLTVVPETSSKLAIGLLALGLCALRFKRTA